MSTETFVNGIKPCEAEKVHLAVSCKLEHKTYIVHYVISINLCLIVRFKIVFRTFVLQYSYQSCRNKAIDGLSII